jgi:predicted transcriptional regulator
MALEIQKNILGIICGLAKYDAKKPVEKNKIFERSNLDEEEFDKIINILQSKNLISKYDTVRVNTGDPYITDTSFVFNSQALNFIENNDKKDSSNIYSVNIRDIINSNAQIGSGNIIQYANIKEILEFLGQIEDKIAKEEVSDKNKADIKSVIEKIRQALNNKPTKNKIQSYMGELYNLIKNINSCIPLAIQISEILRNIQNI